MESDSMNDLVNYLLNFAFDQGIGSILTKEPAPDFPSCAISENRMIIINLNWHHPYELPFIIAHEIAHVLEGDPGTCYYSSSTTRIKAEGRANERAIELILNYCHAYDIPVSNSVAFCEQFGIPTELDYIAYLKIKRIL